MFFKILYVGLKHKGGRLSCADRFYVGAQSVGMNSSLDATDLQQPGLESLRAIVTVFELFLVVYGVSEKSASEILRTEITQHISSRDPRQEICTEELNDLQRRLNLHIRIDCMTAWFAKTIEFGEIQFYSMIFHLNTPCRPQRSKMVENFLMEARTPKWCKISRVRSSCLHKPWCLRQKKNILTSINLYTLASKPRKNQQSRISWSITWIS